MARFGIRAARRPALFTALLLVAFATVSPRGAAADHAGPGEPVQTVTTTERIGGELVEVSRHLDPLDRFASGETGAGVVAPSGHATPRSLAQSCATVNRATDDAANAYQPSSSSVIKVIYAYPTDIGNRLSIYGPVIQTGIRWVDELTAGESGNTRALRFDIGTSAGPGCVDIQTVPLQSSSSNYTAVPSQTFNLLRTELLPRVAGQPGVRNYIVYADGIALPNIGGEAQVLGDDSVAGTQYRLGGLWGMLYGRGGNDFFGSQTNFSPGTTSRSHVDLALHEISHTLGAVQRSAPHHSAAWHCLDEWDILCYDDDGVGGLSTYVACNTPSSQYWDCNRDDYFSPAPAPGTYLATHWNVFNSVFMCPVSQCAPGGVSGPPAIVAESPPPGSTPTSAAPGAPRRSVVKKCRKAKRRAAASRKTCKKKRRS
jgi:hypothetical protein